VFRKPLLSAWTAWEKVTSSSKIGHFQLDSSRFREQGVPRNIKICFKKINGGGTLTITESIIRHLSMPVGRFGTPLWSGGFLTHRQHSAAETLVRLDLIARRTRQIAAAFAVLTLGWIMVDALTVPWPFWGQLALGRLVTSIAFAALAVARPDKNNIVAAYGTIGTLVAIPLVFYLFALGVLDNIEGNGESLLAITAYYYLPFIVIAGLAIFPLTALEGAILALPAVVVMTSAIVIWPELLGAQSALATLWRLLLTAGVSVVAAMSQLGFLLALSKQMTRDSLTGLLVRKVGTELLAHHFARAARHHLPLSLLFIDLDKFKRVNDEFGHKAGDEVLRSVATQLRQVLRQDDIAIRWGGEEFLVALVATDAKRAENVVRRFAAQGVGLRPDGDPLTASIGVAERQADGIADMQALVELADQRMYSAKESGGNRYLACGEAMTALPHPPSAPVKQEAWIGAGRTRPMVPS
jgi:diguanylate cyclase (GGDEF)-like protein